MPINLVQENVGSASATTFSVPLGAAPSAGNLLLAFGTDPSVAAVWPIPAAGQGGATWSLVDTRGNAAGLFFDIGKSVTGAGGATPVFDCDNAGAHGANLSEWSGVSQNIEQETQGGATSASVASPSVTPIAGDCLVIAAFDSTGAATVGAAGGGFTNLTNMSIGSGATKRQVQVAYKIISGGGGAQQATWTLSASQAYDAMIAVIPLAESPRRYEATEIANPRVGPMALRKAFRHMQAHPPLREVGAQDVFAFAQAALGTGAAYDTRHQYFIAPTGNDTTGAGTFASPWRTLTKAYAVMVAGDLTYLRGGTYVGSDIVEVIVGTIGTAALPISIMAYPNEVPIYDGTNAVAGNPCLWFKAASYHTVDGITFRNFDSTLTGDLVIGSDAAGTDHITVTRCRIEHKLGSAANGHGIYIGDHADSITIGGAIGFGNVLIGTYPGETSGAGVEIFHSPGPTNVIVSWNVFDGWTYGVQVADNNVTATILHNTFVGCYNKIGLGGHSTMLVRDNAGDATINSDFTDGTPGSTTQDHNFYNQTFNQYALLGGNTGSGAASDSLDAGANYPPPAGVSANAQAATGTGSAGGASISLQPNGGAGSGTGAAANAAASLKPNAAAGAGTGAAGGPTSSVAPTIQSATGTGAASNAAASLKPNAGAGLGTGAANDASLSLKPNIGAGTGTGAAGGPTASVAPSSQASSGTGVASNAAGSVKPNAAAGLGTGAASNPSEAVAPNAGNAAGTGQAFAPGHGITPATATGTGAANNAAASLQPNSDAATGTGAAGSPSSTVAPVVQGASGTGAANNANKIVAPNAGNAAGTGAANNAGGTVSASITAATGTGAALNASLSLKPNANVGTGTGAAGGPTASVAPTGAAALGTGSAFQPTFSLAPHATAGLGTGLASNASASIAVNGGAASGTGAAYQPTITTGADKSVSAEAATGTGSAGDAHTALAPNASAGTGTGAAGSANSNVQPSAIGASGSGSAAGPTFSVAPHIGAATGSGSAFNATASTSSSTSANATAATGAGTANPASVRIEPSPATATGSGSVPGASASAAPHAGNAAGTGQALSATISITEFKQALAQLASGLGSANGARVDISVTAGSAQGFGFSYAPLIGVPPEFDGAYLQITRAPKGFVILAIQAKPVLGSFSVSIKPSVGIVVEPDPTADIVVEPKPSVEVSN